MVSHGDATGAQIAPKNDPSVEVRVHCCMRYSYLDVFVFNPSLLFRVQETDIAEVPENWKHQAVVYRLLRVSTSQEPLAGRLCTQMQQEQEVLQVTDAQTNTPARSSCESLI